MPRENTPGDTILNATAFNFRFSGCDGAVKHDTADHVGVDVVEVPIHRVAQEDDSAVLRKVSELVQPTECGRAVRFRVEPVRVGCFMDKTRRPLSSFAIPKGWWLFGSCHRARFRATPLGTRVDF